jgi:hypothetical protein
MMDTNEALHVARNPRGHTVETVRIARIVVADAYERAEKGWADASAACNRAADERNKAVAELAALRAQGVPEGWQLVPVEPTIEMMDGAFDDIRLSDAHTTYGVTEHVWAYMLAAAPKPPADDTALCARLAQERERCIAIVFGQCDSDNVAQRTADAIRAMGDAQ